jgi:hypothetical protein
MKTIKRQNDCAKLDADALTLMMTMLSTDQEGEDDLFCQLMDNMV